MFQNYPKTHAIMSTRRSTYEEQCGADLSTALALLDETFERVRVDWELNHSAETCGG